MSLKSPHLLQLREGYNQGIGFGIFRIFVGVMRNIFVCAALALALCSSCCSRSGESVPRSADLLFVKIPADYNLGEDTMGGAIASSTAPSDSSLMTIHVAILEVEKDSTWVIDATIKHGVDRYPLDTFLTDFRLKDGSLPVLEVKRPEVSRKEAIRFIENAKTYIGQPYDVYFLPDNGAMYCSELVYCSYVRADGEHLFSEYPMNFLDRDGKMPQYWTQLFSLLGQEVPQGVPGTNPQAMSTEPVLRDVCRLAENQP